jgi:hypothetical protein
MNESIRSILEPSITTDHQTPHISKAVAWRRPTGRNPNASNNQVWRSNEVRMARQGQLRTLLGLPPQPYMAAEFSTTGKSAHTSNLVQKLSQTPLLWLAAQKLPNKVELRRLLNAPDQN